MNLPLTLVAILPGIPSNTSLSFKNCVPSETARWLSFRHKKKTKFSPSYSIIIDVGVITGGRNPTNMIYHVNNVQAVILLVARPKGPVVIEGGAICTSYSTKDRKTLITTRALTSASSI